MFLRADAFRKLGNVLQLADMDGQLPWLGYGASSEPLRFRKHEQRWKARAGKWRF